MESSRVGVVKPPTANTSHAGNCVKSSTQCLTKQLFNWEMAAAPTEVPETAQPIHVRDGALL